MIWLNDGPAGACAKTVTQNCFNKHVRRGGTTMKSQIIEQLGQTGLLLPSLVSEGLSANDQVKARLSVLQAAGRHARDPNGARFDLADECRAVGIDPVPMQALVNSASVIDGARITAAGLDTLAGAIWDDVETMIRAVNAADAAEGDAALKRLAAIRAAGGPGPADSIEAAQVARLTALSDGRSRPAAVNGSTARGDTRADGHGDSLHRLVMDLHKALNRLTAEQAEEVLAGAHVYGLQAEDRPAVEAFMRGLESTRTLKFDHPGLSTTATRSGGRCRPAAVNGSAARDETRAGGRCRPAAVNGSAARDETRAAGRLTIQNDIGETDAHVVVIAVEPDAVTVTYTDVHRARAKFFTGLFRDFAVQWSGLDRKSAEGLGDDGSFYLVTGRFPADGAKARDGFLEALGASLVFLIDWNKARKLLRTWVTKGDAVHILSWAAHNRVGHRAFLELGGSDLVASAVNHATPARIGFGERLDRALGRDAAIDFLKTVLRVSAEALLQGGSVRLARDRIEADLVRHLQRVDAALLAIVIRQAGLAREIAAGIARFVAEEQAQRPFDRAALASRARRIEEKADKIAIDARREIARFEAHPSIERLVNRVEDAIDELEQAAFIASLVPDQVPAGLLEPLARLCSAAIAGAEAAATGVAAAADVPNGQRADSEDALAAVGRLMEEEHHGDDAERAVTALIFRGDFDLKTALSVLDLARALERATDRFAGFGHLLHEHVLADLSA